MAFLGTPPSPEVEGLDVEACSSCGFLETCSNCGFLGPKIWVLRCIKGTDDSEEEVSSLRRALPNPPPDMLNDLFLLNILILEEVCLSKFWQRNGL